MSQVWFVRFFLIQNGLPLSLRAQRKRRKKAAGSESLWLGEGTPVNGLSGFHLAHIIRPNSFASSARRTVAVSSQYSLGSS